jgi:hypothetical protein
MSLSGKEIEVEEGAPSLVLFVPQFIEDVEGRRWVLDGEIACVRKSLAKRA